ncbi:hypothetical protein CPB86DRAFT_790013 [Serendipita vermifera]|nr:hypothetical protein CPB86DRAFT_790013 [Serendipita vermifera]
MRSLHRVEISATEKRSNPIEFDAMLPLFSVSSIAIIRVAGVKSVSDDAALVLPELRGTPNAYGQSNVKTLAFFDSMFSEDELDMVLRLPKALEVFIYHESSTHESSRSAERVQRAINHCSSTLVTLFLGLFGTTLQPNLFLSFSNFQSLKRLFICHEFIDDGAIVDRLPSSLEALELGMLEATEDATQRVIECIRIILTNISVTILPRLFWVGVPSSYSWCDLSSLKGLASAKGIKIDGTHW